MNISPLRYPGSKFKITPLIEKYLDRREFSEPFCGGSSIGLSLLSEDKIDKLYLNDLDKGVYSFWKLIKEDYESLIFFIKDVDITMNIYYQMRELFETSSDLYDLAYSCLFLNRTNFSGILSSSPIGGYNQSGKYKINCSLFFRFINWHEIKTLKFKFFIFKIIVF